MARGITGIDHILVGVEDLEAARPRGTAPVSCQSIQGTLAGGAVFRLSHAHVHAWRE